MTNIYTMNHVYIMYHIYKHDNHEEQEKLIGIFKTKKKAEEAIIFLKNKPGFSTYPKGFFIEKYELNKIHWTEGFVTD